MHPDKIDLVLLLFGITLVILMFVYCNEVENPMPIGFKRQESHSHPIIMVNGYR